MISQRGLYPRGEGMPRENCNDTAHMLKEDAQNWIFRNTVIAIRQDDSEYLDRLDILQAKLDGTYAEQSR